MPKLKLLFLLGSRSEWGYIKPLIIEAKNRGHFPSVCATNMVVQSRYQDILDEITSLDILIVGKIYSAFEGDSHVAMSKAIGIVTLAFSDILELNKPDWVILAGDRYEQLGAAVSCAYMYQPTAHVQSGEKSGNIDGVARHAITKLVHLHFTANFDATERVRNLGEEVFRIHETGAPQLDSLLNDTRPSRIELQNQNIIKSGPYFLIAFHSVTEDIYNSRLEIQKLKQFLRKYPQDKIWILPNNDAGSFWIRDYLLSNQDQQDRVLNNISRPSYAALLENCIAIIGNSSSGILEAPSFGKPAINIGRRQKDRFRGENVLDIDELNEVELDKAIKCCMDINWLKKIKTLKNPYGDGKSSQRILDVLENSPRDSKLITKILEY